MRSVAILLLCIGAALAVEYAAVPCDATEFSWRWGNYTSECGCDSVKACQTQLCQAAVDYDVWSSDKYESVWGACEAAYDAIYTCEGSFYSDVMTEANLAIAEAVVASYNYCDDSCNDWAIGYWWAGWQTECTGCTDPTSEDCLISNCAYYPPNECSTYGYKLASCVDYYSNETFQAEMATFTSVQDCYIDNEYVYSSDFCNGDRLDAQFKLWYAGCPACDVDAADYSEADCTATTCGEQSACTQYSYNIRSCEGNTEDADAHFKDVQAAYDQYYTCYDQSQLDCTSEGVDTILKAFETDCAGDVCAAWAATDSEDCYNDYWNLLYCSAWGSPSDDQQTQIAAIEKDADACNPSTDGSSGDWSYSSSGDWSSSAEAEYMSSTAQPTDGLSADNGASSLAISSVALLASVVAMLL